MFFLNIVSIRTHANLQQLCLFGICRLAGKDASKPCNRFYYHKGHFYFGQKKLILALFS